MTDGTIVVVEDDPNIADLLDAYLRRAGFRVLLAADATTGLDLIATAMPRLAVLDVGLPGDLDGFEVCRRLRAQPSTRSLPVLLLTARADEMDRVTGLELGADDYVTKPFSPREVVLRVQALLRRSGGESTTAPTVLEVGDVAVDLGRREVRLAGAPVAMATREFELLRVLIENLGLALTRRQLLDAAWGYDWYGDDRTVDVHVRQLRKKLGPTLPLATVWSVGYRLG